MEPREMRQADDKLVKLYSFSSDLDVYGMN